jgi:hypothetical protein
LHSVSIDHLVWECNIPAHIAWLVMGDLDTTLSNKVWEYVYALC